MFPQTLISKRRLPPAVRGRLQVAYARAWEALSDTHYQQAVLFARRLADRLSLEESLDRYFREVAVPVAMQETVRARALLQLADALPPVADPADAADPWQRLRPDRLVESVRRRAQWVEETGLQCRMAACLADAAVTETHTRMAVEVAELVAATLPADEAVMLYIRSFDLPVRDGDAVFRAALARFGERHLVPTGAPRLHVDPPAPVAHPEPASAPTLAPVPAPAFGLRVIV
ncbi:MAG TPA: hypothetical protein VFU46_12015 [Gemmatimonadales bacterium]|nr:hypothetical protein [Gemmatimonadales bacterium]